MRNVGWGTTISFAMTLCVHAIGESGSARAQSKPAAPRGSALASALAPHWNHNGSLVSLLSDGATQKLFYDTPRVGLLDAGVKPGTLLFEGKRDGTAITGTAYQFYRTCKPRGFPVTGSTSDDKKQITLKGKAPLVDAACKVTGTREDVLVFNVSTVTPGEPPKQAQTAAAPPSTPAKNFPSEANRDEANRSAAPNTAAIVSTVIPNEPPKDKQATPSVPDKAPPAETAKPDAAKIEAAKAEAAKTEGAKAEAAKKAAQQVAAAPPAEPVKDAKSVPASAQKPDETKTASIPTERTNAQSKPEPPKTEPPKTEAPKTEAVKIETAKTETPKVEPSKETQLASLPGAANSAVKDAPKEAAKDAAKDDASKAKPPVIPAVAPVTGSDANKPAVLVDNRTAQPNAPEKMMEIVLKNGRTLRIGRDIEPDALLKIISLLERE